MENSLLDIYNIRILKLQQILAEIQIIISFYHDK